MVSFSSVSRASVRRIACAGAGWRWPTVPGATIFELDRSGSMAEDSPLLGRWRDRTTKADKCQHMCSAARSVKSSAGMRTACMAVMAPLPVWAIRFCRQASPVPMVGW